MLRLYTDITERRRDEDRIRYRAHHDGLTLLANRETFLDRLTQHVNRAALSGSSFAVHYLDLDRFKAINDSMGHAAGDRVLAVVAQRIRNAIREDDVAGRMGGDEFAIMQATPRRHRSGGPARPTRDARTRARARHRWTSGQGSGCR